MLVGLLVTFRSKDRPLAPPGEDADPKEYPWYFEGRGQSPAVISGRRFRVEGCGKAHQGANDGGGRRDRRRRATGSRAAARGDYSAAISHQ
jgi:hypothetical protein